MGRNEVGVNLDDVPTASPLMDLPEVLRARLTSRFLPRLSVLAAFGIALFFVAAGMAVRLLFAEELGQRATFIFFVPGVVVAGAPSGLPAGTVAAMSGAGAGLWGERRHGPAGGRRARAVGSGGGAGRG